ncbi:MAG: AmmeMemoRadiSam system protein A [Methylotenera sp.]|nr:AmmeMemoRadiSam system protein A [Methylotenera sp.]MDO9388773.1 AmmeMemoRadiSam system protein A [Methylotenera sp.]MDP2101715.1 AmmeMemoRadiSam system protein A [Methylotenera sp.]MDP2280874.1 AmmeMemoRadiSam system protein A [Methylotenera sp.]MDP3060972.1 AmmeMemoRadiSam system protein A [Methylotenera sp.]
MAQLSESTTDSAGEVLISIARAAIFDAFGKPYDETTKDFPLLHEKGASFVTLTQNQQLRGCIGTLEAHRPLLIDVKANAEAAAFRDPRFSPLTEAELTHTKIEISLLSAMQAMAFYDEHDALAQLQPGIDGVVFEFGRYRSTFLPQVWEQLPDADVFMAHLKHKAGLQPGFWDDEVKLYRYTVSKWKEKDITKDVKVLK